MLCLQAALETRQQANIFVPSQRHPGVLPRVQCQLSFTVRTAQVVIAAEGQLICQTAFVRFTLFLHAVLDVRPYAAHLCRVLS